MKIIIRALSASVLILLGGCARTSAVSSTASAARATTRAANSQSTPSAVTSSAIAEGQRLFSDGSCQRCHGVGGVGGSGGPRLTDGAWLQIRGDYSEIVDLITRGVSFAEIKNRSRLVPMDPRGRLMNLTDAQVRVVAAYVYSISRAKP